jgi:para-nitrobenzyl esterase
MISRRSHDMSKRVSRRLFLGGTAAAAAALVVENPARAVTTGKDAITGPVRIDTGLVQGVPGALSGVTVFKGIPFAATTAGENRWRPPRRAASWSGVYLADTFGDACPQTSLSGAALDIPMSEDCLNLNVWTAARAPDERLPVFVWIYGGRFVGGYASMAEFDGSGLARKGLVVVALNYRTASYGFLSTPALTAESGHGSSGNYGLLDQVAAMRWVRRNIAAFGGDPGNVTIAGQSAGSASVLNHVFSPLSKGLFHRAILESGAFYPKDSQIGALATSYRTLERAEALGTSWMATVGASTLAEARALSTDALLTGLADNDTAIATVASIDGYPPVWRPVLDGWVMPMSYWDTLVTGSQNDVPIMNGNNKDENGASPDLSVTEAAFQTWAGTYYPPLAEEFLDLYPVTSDAEGGPQTDAATVDRDRVSAHDWATSWAWHAKSPVYTYYWTHAVPGQDMGAYHGSEINYVFDNLYGTDDPWTSADYEIANTLSDYVVNFAKTGDPNGQGLARWAPTNAADQTVMELGDAWGPVPIATPDKAAFYRRFFSLQPPW